MTNHPRRIVYLLLILLLSVGCSDELRKEPALELAKQFYSTIEKEEYQKTLELVSPELFKGSTPEEFIEVLKEKRERYGTIKKYRIVTWEVWKELKMGRSGVYYSLWYLVTYKNGTLMEHFLMFKPITTNEILIYNYDWSTEHRIKRNK